MASFIFFINVIINSFFLLCLLLEISMPNTMESVGRRTTEHRKGNFKNTGFGKDDVRKRREEAAVEIRKNKKEESLQKRRNFSVPDGMEHEEKMSNATAQPVVKFYFSYFFLIIIIKILFYSIYNNSNCFFFFLFLFIL